MIAGSARDRDRKRITPGGARASFDLCDTGIVHKLKTARQSASVLEDESGHLVRLITYDGVVDAVSGIAGRDFLLSFGKCDSGHDADDQHGGQK